MRSFVATLALLVSLLAMPAFAVQPDEVLDDPVLEQRARDISADLRCLVCQNQSIDDSDADLARDLRLVVRERLVAGDSDTEVVDYIVDRYGEYVLLKPVFGLHTLLLWAAAPAILLAGLAVLFVAAARRKNLTQQSPEMNAEEKAALASLADSDD